jgi:hypothetical protein
VVLVVMLFADPIDVDRDVLDLLPVWPAGVEFQQLIYRQTDLPEDYPTLQDIVPRLHSFDRDKGGCIWDGLQSQPASSLLPSSLPESSPPPSSLPEPSSLATTASSQVSNLPAVPSQNSSRFNIKSHRETTFQEMQRQVYSMSRKVQVLETAGQRDRERLAGLEEEIRQLGETNRRLTIAGAEAALNVSQRDATIDRLERAHQVQRNSWGTMREAQDREIRELRSRSFGRPTGREYVWVRGQPRRGRGRAVFPARVNCRPAAEENMQRVKELTELCKEKDTKIVNQDSAIAGLTQSCNDKGATITTHESTIANLTQSVNDQDATIVARNSTINALETSIANLTQSRDEKEATIIARNSTINAANARIAEVETLLATAEQSLVTADAEIEELAEAAEAANGVIGAASIRITVLEASLQRAQENAEVADRTIVQHERSLGTATMRRLILFADLGAAVNRITALEGEAVVANTRNVELEGFLGAANTRVTALEGSLATAQTENQNLSSSLSFVTTRYMERVSQMWASVSALRARGFFGHGRNRERKPFKFAVFCDHPVHGEGLANVGKRHHARGFSGRRQYGASKPLKFIGHGRNGESKPRKFTLLCDDPVHGEGLAGARFDVRGAGIDERLGHQESTDCCSARELAAYKPGRVSSTAGTCQCQRPECGSGLASTSPAGSTAIWSGSKR